jgi:hypothetical protein
MYIVVHIYVESNNWTVGAVYQINWTQRPHEEWGAHCIHPHLLLDRRSRLDYEAQACKLENVAYKLPVCAVEDASHFMCVYGSRPSTES